MDPFQILGLPEDASLKDIKKAFHILSLQCYADKAGEGSTLLFQYVNAACEMLKLKDYDLRKGSGASARLTRKDCDNYSFEEFWDDIKRDHEAAGRAQETHEQRENWNRAYSSSIPDPTQATSQEEGCPVCGEAPFKLFEPKKVTEKERPARFASDRL